MPISAAAMDGISANGHRWRYRIRLGQSPALLGKYNDAAETDSPATDAEVEAVALKIVESVRRFLRSHAGGMADDLAARADELEFAADCGLEAVNYAMGDLYDCFDYWRILVESPRLPR